MHSFYFRAFNYIDNFKSVHLGIYFSLFFHLVILLFTLGLPDFFKPKKILVPQVIPIEILNISDITSLTSLKKNNEISNKEIKKIKQKKFNSSENTEIQKIDLQEKPKKKINPNDNISNNKDIIEKPKSKNVSLKDKKNVELENLESLKINKIKPKLKPKITGKVNSKSDVKIENEIKQVIKKEDKKKIEDKSKPIQKPEPDLNLSTMLKDLRNEEIKNVSNNDDEENKLEETEEDKVEENLEVSISEMDLVIQQLRSCFNPRAGTQIVGDEMVKISAKINRQAYVRKDTVQIIATNISKSNPYYEAITESAVATLYNPLCSKLKLPLDKYDSWRDLKITIDYSWIKN